MSPVEGKEVKSLIIALLHQHTTQHPLRSICLDPEWLHVVRLDHNRSCKQGVLEIVEGGFYTSSLCDELFLLCVQSLITFLKQILQQHSHMSKMLHELAII